MEETLCCGQLAGLWFFCGCSVTSARWVGRTSTCFSLSPRSCLSGITEPVDGPSNGGSGATAETASARSAASVGGGQKWRFRSADLRVFHGRAPSIAKAEVDTVTALLRRMIDDQSQYRRYMASGRKCLVRLCAGRATGCVGPLTRANTHRHALEEYFFDDWPKAAAWAEANRGSFLLLHIDSDEGWEEAAEGRRG
jgi:hypothetical protein